MLAHNKPARHKKPSSFNKVEMARIERYDTRKRVIWKIRHSGPGWSGVRILRVV